MKKWLLTISIVMMLAPVVANAKVCDNLTAPGCQKAWKMLEAGWGIAVGDKARPDTWMEHADNMVYHKIVTAEKFAAGITLKEATDYWKFFLAELSPLNGGYATVAVQNAWNEVYGRKPLKAETDPWLAQIKQKKAWYTTIVLAESQKLKADDAAYLKMIRACFGDSYGRWETDKELAYWKSNRMHYRLIRNILRQELYSPENRANARKVVALALQNSNTVKTGKTVPASDAEIGSWYAKFAVNKLLYNEMMKALGTPIG